jgi:hypothetical protein
MLEKLLTTRQQGKYCLHTSMPGNLFESNCRMQENSQANVFASPKALGINCFCFVSLEIVTRANLHERIYGFTLILPSALGERQLFVLQRIFHSTPIKTNPWQKEAISWARRSGRNKRH